MEARLKALREATPDRWVALSANEDRKVAEASTFEEVARAAELAGEPDPVIIRVPEDWATRVF